MKFTSLFVVAALFGHDQTQAVQVKSRSRALSKSQSRIGAMTLVDCELEYQRTGQVLAECQQYLQTGATATPAPVAAQAAAAPLTAAAPVDNTMLNQAAAPVQAAQTAPVAPAQAAAPVQAAQAAPAAPAQQ